VDRGNVNNPINRTAVQSTMTPFECFTAQYGVISETCSDYTYNQVGNQYAQLIKTN